MVDYFQKKCCCKVWRKSVIKCDRYSANVLGASKRVGAVYTGAQSEYCHHNSSCSPWKCANNTFDSRYKDVMDEPLYSNNVQPDEWLLC